MFTDWNIYYQPLHLNNVTGESIPNGDYGNPDTTPFIMLAEANGGTYIPKSTNYMDVYSGGSPFTFTQELVQRGAEVQVDTFRIAIVGTTFAQCKERMQLIRTALNNQHMFGPQILSIRLSHQTTYTEWFVHGAIIQEEETMLGRDIIDQSNPVLYASVNITRSPYGADRNAQYEHIVYVQENGKLITSSTYNVLNYNELYGAYVNLYFNIDFLGNLSVPSPSTFGPIMFASVINDTFVENDTSQSGTLTAGGSASLTAIDYQIQEVTNNYPLQTFVVADVEDNLVEMRLDINGYKTAYVRAIGSHIDSTNGTERLFVLPTIDISTLFDGAKEYAVYYTLPITIELRNLNRGGTTTYDVKHVRICRVDNMVQTYPTSEWTLLNTPDFMKVNVYSFYDTVEYPAQPMPVMKAHATSYQKYYTPGEDAFQFVNNEQYEETLELRGTFVRMKQLYGGIRCVVYQLGYDCSANLTVTPLSLQSITIKYAPAHLSIKE